MTIKSKAKKNEVNVIYYRNKMYLHALHLPATSLWLWHGQLFFECLFNLLVLRFYFIRAIGQYLSHWSAVFAKRKSFAKLAAQSGGKLLSLKQVTRIVLDNINSVETKRLR